MAKQTKSSNGNKKDGCSWILSWTLNSPLVIFSRCCYKNLPTTPAQIVECVQTLSIWWFLDIPTGTSKTIACMGSETYMSLLILNMLTVFDYLYIETLNPKVEPWISKLFHVTKPLFWFLIFCHIKS